MSNNGFNGLASLPVSTATLRAEGGGNSLEPQAGAGFVSTPYVEELTRRALTYLKVDYPIHFAGPAGTGKTTLAFHVAAQLGRPAVLVHGDDEFGTSDLIGKDVGYRKSKLIDNFIHSVIKTEENMSALWIDNGLTNACKRGYTLIYDEFNRSRPEANNVLLGVLEERVLSVPGLGRSAGGYLEVHPDFRAIFTSNPEEYAGVHKTQDALLDRLITMQLGHYDRDSEVRITTARSGIAPEDAEVIVDIVREARGLGVNNHRPTIRACIAIAGVLAYRKLPVLGDEPTLLAVCRDVLNTDSAKVSRGGEPLMTEKIEQIVKKVTARSGKRSKKR
jgi:nitric oxide reductase NorQ protein